MRAALESVPGVRKVEVSYDEQKAVVFFTAGTATEKDMVTALETAGYRAWPTSQEKRE